MEEIENRYNPNTFSLMIEEIAAAKKTSHIDTIVDYCVKNEIELEAAASLCNSSLVGKIREEAESLNFIPKSRKLPF